MCSNKLLIFPERRAFVSAMDFSVFLLSFLTIIEENVRFVDGAFADTIFKMVGWFQKNDKIAEFTSKV